MIDGRGEGRRSQSALSLIEIMVAVALLAVIILGLVAMFSQTRKAFTLGLNTADYESSGRVVMDIFDRELQQMTPGSVGLLFANNAPPPPLPTPYPNPVNFYVDVDPLSPYTAWPLVVTNDAITNIMDRMFFVTRYNQQWTAIGYKVDPNTIGSGVGTLYRYSATSVSPATMSTNSIPNLLADFTNNAAFGPPGYPAKTGPFSRVIDGVVDFRVRAFAGNSSTLPGPGCLITNSIPYTNNGTVNIQLFITPNDPPGEYQYAFLGNAVPGYVEVELAVLEPRTLERYRALTNSPSLAASFLTNHAGQVHVFRQRIPIRAVDPLVYP